MMDIMGSSGIQSYGNDEQSFDNASQEAITAIILNQSNESCCCSDDEFTMKAANSQKEQEFEDYEVNSQQQSNKNLKRL